MYVSQKHKTLVIQPKETAHIAAAIADSKVSDKDPRKIFVKHTLDNVTVLRQLGYKKTPSPVLYEYSWPGDKVPYKHQFATVSFLTAAPRAFVLSGIGSGKTAAALWSADYLMGESRVQKCLIISPLSTLERVWGDAIFTGLFHRKAAVLHGTATKRLKLFNDPKFDFYIINPDGFGIIADAFKVRPDVNCVIIDESSSLRNIGINRFRVIRNCIRANPPDYLWMMTATPTPNAPTDAWGQAAVMGDTKGYTSSGFKEVTMVKRSMFRWEPRPQSEKFVQKLLSPAVRFRTSDCIDLPPTIYHTRQAELSPQQKVLIKKMLDTFAVEMHSGVITAVNEADKQNKILQLITGFVYKTTATKEERNAEHVDVGDRLKILMEIVEEQIEGKAIIFVPYTELVHILSGHLVEAGYTVEVVDGKTSANKRNQVFKDFQDAADPRIIVAHPRTMSHGLTLTAAATIIWYAPYASNEIYEQANGRIVRPSQVRTTNIFHIEASSFERRLYRRLKDRQTLQGSLLEYIQSKEM